MHTDIINNSRTARLALTILIVLPATILIEPNKACGRHMSANYSLMPMKTTLMPALYAGATSAGRVMPMRNISEDFHFSVPGRESRLQRFKTIRHDPQMLDIRQKLMEANLWENPAVQRKFWLGQVGTDKTRLRVRTELLELIERRTELRMVLDDPFMPYASAEQISNGGQGIHILNQANNNIQFCASEYSYCLLWLVLGPQGSGKSSAVFHQLKQIYVPVQILDHKGTWEFRAEQLNYKVIPAECVRFDLDIEEDMLPLYLHSILQYGTSVRAELSVRGWRHCIGST
jgi:hypothetical protein